MIENTSTGPGKASLASCAFCHTNQTNFTRPSSSRLPQLFMSHLFMFSFVHVFNSTPHETAPLTHAGKPFNTCVMHSLLK